MQALIQVRLPALFNLMSKRRKITIIAVSTLLLLGGILFYFRAFLPLFVTVASPIPLQTPQEEKDFNVLLLGKGGARHDGPDLTDTIMVANVQPAKNRVNLISLPRDLWIPHIPGKINTAYAFGQEKGDGKGMLLAKAVVQRVTGVDIDYVFVLDFDGFTTLIDHLGGIDVNVKRSFDDYEYPVEGNEADLCGHTEEEAARLATESASMLEVFPCRYKHLHFDKGVQHMDGNTALEFVRSRHALGPEGSDFARSARQQEVIKATREKALSLNILLNPVKVLGIYDIVKQNIDTDIPVEQYDKFAKIAKRMSDVTIKSFVISEDDLSNDTYGLLTNPPTAKEYGYQWVLAPRAGNGAFDEIREYVACVISGNNCLITKTGISSMPATGSAELSTH